MLSLRRGAVVEVTQDDHPVQRLKVEIAGELRPAIADVTLVGVSEVGDEVVVNVAALDLELGSGGFDIVHLNLTRGLDSVGPSGAHVMKLNYSSLQHAVEQVERGGELKLPLDKPVGVLALHGQLAPVAWAIAQAGGDLRVGYIQTVGGALPGALSDVVRELLEQGLLCAHVTAGQSYGGVTEAITTAGALYHGLTEDRWDVALCGPGPGILGSGSVLGNGGLIALDSAHTALALGTETVIVPRVSSGDPRARHRDLSHHTETVLELLLKPVTIALPQDSDITVERHTVKATAVDLEGYGDSGLPQTTMGRALDEDAEFFAAALAGGGVLAELSG